MSSIWRASPVRTTLLDELDRGRGPAALDLSAVTYLASAGVALLLDVVERAQRNGRSLDLHAPRSGHVRAVLELVGLAAPAVP